MLDWGDSMEVIIHLPRSKEGQEELAKCVATVHAQLIYNYISRLECSTEQKVALLDAIQENIHDQIKKEKEGCSRRDTTRMMILLRKKKWSRRKPAPDTKTYSSQFSL